MLSLKDVKSWSTEIENQINSEWNELDLYSFDINSNKKIYSIDTPPPYVNAPIHIGQALTCCYMDFFARYKRMRGYQVIFPLGLDNNGLPIEMGAEKKFNISAFEVGRDKFLDYCKKLLKEAGTATKDTFSRLGISFTSYEEGDHIGSVYQTDSPAFRSLTQSTFIDLYKKGLIYEDKRINNWDTKLKTTIADSEIDYENLPSTFNYIKWKIKDSSEEILIGTTRPELICSCGMVIFNPGDLRYKHLEGKIVLSPIFNKEILIKSHPAADPEKGTGIVMMCSAGDLSDIQFFREQNLEPIISINQDGTMNENSSQYCGLTIKEAREKIISDLKSKGLLEKQEKIVHRTPVSERSGTEIEFIEMDEYYVKQLDFREEIRKLSEKINFYPISSKRILDTWIDSISIDWPISRRRFYATPIPIWFAYKDNQKLIAIPNKKGYFEPWKQEVDSDFEVYLNNKKIGVVSDFKDLKWTGESRVLDTWMDSSITELFILGYNKNLELFKKAYPASLRPQGKEIVRTWLYYTLLRGYFETKEPCFNDVWIHQHIVDEKGYKMSKSKGNVIDPLKLLDDYGADAIRMWGAIEGDLSKQDLKCSEEKIKSELKTLTKLINIVKFVDQFEKPNKPKKIVELDQLFIDYIEDLTKRTRDLYDVYDFYNPSLELRKFIWDLFSSHYIELVKSRAYNQENLFSKEESDSAKYAMNYILERFLYLIYPIVPRISFLIARDRNIDILTSLFPEPNKTKMDLKLIKDLTDFNSSVWKIKKESGLSLKNEVKGIEIPKSLEIFEKDLRASHKI